MSDFHSLLDQWAKWELETFPQATTASRLNHLRKEVEELRDDPSDLMEYADCMALLLLAARSKGYSFNQISVAMEDKLKINKGREWGETNSEGFVEHIRGRCDVT